MGRSHEAQTMLLSGTNVGSGMKSLQGVIPSLPIITELDETQESTEIVEGKEIFIPTADKWKTISQNVEAIRAVSTPDKEVEVSLLICAMNEEAAGQKDSKFEGHSQSSSNDDDELERGILKSYRLALEEEKSRGHGLKTEVWQILQDKILPELSELSIAAAQLQKTVKEVQASEEASGMKLIKTIATVLDLMKQIRTDDDLLDKDLDSLSVQINNKQGSPVDQYLGDHGWEAEAKKMLSEVVREGLGLREMLGKAAKRERQAHEELEAQRNLK
eukprot:588513-Rhodomonas_salina.1